MQLQGHIITHKAYICTCDCVKGWLSTRIRITDKMEICDWDSLKVVYYQFLSCFAPLSFDVCREYHGIGRCTCTAIDTCPHLPME